MKTKTEKKRPRSRASRPRLRIASVEFTPTPGVEKRLGRVYQLLLARHIEESQATEEDKPISHERPED